MSDGVDVLHTIGGDDTNTTAADLAAHVQEAGHPVVQRLTAGGSSMDPEERAALLTSWALDRDRRRHVRDQLESLSPQQRRVLELLASGGVELGHPQVERIAVDRLAASIVSTSAPVSTDAP